MKKTAGIRFTTALLLGGSMLALSAPAMAQSPEQQAEDDTPAPETTSNEIVVTGIRASIQGATDAKRNSDQIQYVLGELLGGRDIFELSVRKPPVTQQYLVDNALDAVDLNTVTFAADDARR